MHLYELLGMSIKDYELEDWQINVLKKQGKC